MLCSPVKIVIRGDRNSGKTCLWHRLQGHKFVEEYVPTPEIQATSIQWNYKATDDIVKVDVWDVVDKGKPKQQDNSLKLAHLNADEDECRLDANFLDVYKGAHAVLVMFDITKKWTYQYVERELPKIPAHIPVLVLANHRDMGAHRVVNLDELQALVESINRPAGSAGIFFLESSMKSGFGLKYVHKFFNLPFLLVQRESLLKQLETNHLDVESCLEELYYDSTSEEQSYDHFLQAVQEKNNQQKKTKQTAEVAQNVNGHKETPPYKPPAAVQPVPNDVIKASGEPAKHKSPPTSLSVKVEPEQKSAGGGLFSPSMMASTSPTETQKEPEKKGFMSRFFRGSAPKQEAPKLSEEAPPVIARNPPTSSSLQRGPVDINKFIPEDEDTDNFLNDITEPKREAVIDSDSTSDEDAGNPMVAGFQEELDSDDQISPGTHKVYSYSDSDDDYATLSKLPPSVQTPVSSRSVPRSRVSPLPHVEDEQLQHLEINSDNSSLADEPYIMPDDDDISDVEMSYKPSLNDSFDKENQEASIPSKKDLQFQSKSVDEKPVEYFKKGKKNASDFEDQSSDEETANTMVSTVMEDVGSDEDIPSSPKGLHEENDQEPTKKLNLRLETNDLDFLEQISTSTPEQATASHKSSSSKHHRKTKKKHDHDDQESTKKHKHKKKKHKSKDTDSSESRSSKKKSTKTKTAEVNALEEFLAGGDDAF